MHLQGWAVHPDVQLVAISALGDLEAAVEKQGAASASLCKHPCPLWQLTTQQSFEQPAQLPSASKPPRIQAEKLNTPRWDFQSAQGHRHSRVNHINVKKQCATPSEIIQSM